MKKEGPNSMDMENSAEQKTSWSLIKKMAFRFAFIFFILFIVCLDWSVNPVLPYLYYEGGLAIFLDTIISWVGKNVFQIPYTIISPYDAQHNDRTYIYLLYLTMAVTAALGTFIWSVWDRKRTNYDRLYYWLTAILRYYLAFTLFLFALEKFFKMQFPDMDYYTLTQPVGDMSPMGLAWTFFGYSYGYNVFMGIAESAALLLLFRRTMTFGALITLFSLTNVMAVNFNYDVHAKIYPVALFVMTLFLLLPSINRIIQFFFTNQAVSLPILKAPVLEKKWMNISKIVLKFGLIAFCVILPAKDYFGYRHSIDTAEMHMIQSGLSGVYDVESFVQNSDTLKTDNPLRWKQVLIGGARSRIRLNGDSIAFMDISVDKKEILVYGDRNAVLNKEQELYNALGISDNIYYKMDSLLVEAQSKYRLQFELPHGTKLELKGKIENDSVFITAKKRPVTLKEFRLMKRGFHWVTEAAYMY